MLANKRGGLRSATPWRIKLPTSVKLKEEQNICAWMRRRYDPLQGKIKRHHFAHKADLEQCDPDNALHETAKAAIVQGFLRARDHGKEYPVKFPCGGCDSILKVDTAIEGASIATERAVVQGTRSDLVITGAEGKSPRVIIEIVVHHDLEDGTEKRYKDSGIPVVRVRPTWETVDELRQEIQVKEILNIPTPVCWQCRENQRNREERSHGIEQKIRAKIAPPQAATSKLETIRQDRFGAFLRRDTRELVNENARKLARIWFGQRSSRPTLFNVKVDEWSIFADLDSTEVMRIWELECAPGLYAFPEDTNPPKCRECVLEIVRTILEENGIEIRRYFMDHGAHNHRGREPEHDESY